MIPVFNRVQCGGQPIRELGPKSHLQTKKGTPTMGGGVIVSSVIISSVVFSKMNMNLLIPLFVFVSFAVLGGVDDYTKVIKRNSIGVKASWKLIIQFIIAITTVYLLSVNISTEVKFPFNYVVDLGLLYYPVAVLAIVSYSNAINITDGLDGLVTVPIILASSCLAIISFYITGDHEINTTCLALIGACLGFLFFNTNPAKIFMGDVGSLSIGSMFAVMSIITKHEFVFIVVSGLFIMEAFSVVIQVFYFKVTKGKRVFRMAPIHHHFEQLGWGENKIVVRFWIVSALCGVIGMSLA